MKPSNDIFKPPDSFSGAATGCGAAKRTGWRFFLFLTMIFASCASSSDIFSDLGENVSSPTGFAIDTTARRLYMTNANSGVLYDWRQGNFQVLDITNPQSPTLVGSVATESFSGEVYLDTTLSRAIVTNRFSTDSVDHNDKLLVVDINEAASTFLDVTTVETAKDPFAFACCASTNQLLFTTTSDLLQFVNVSESSLTPTDVNLLQPLSTGATLNTAEISDVVMIGEMAFLSRNAGGILVVNTNEMGDTTVNPVDYFISDVRSPRGMAVYGTKLLIADEDTVNGTFTPRVLVLETSSLTPDTSNTTTQVFDKDDNGLVTTSIAVGRDPQEIEVSGTQGFVTNSRDDTVSVIDLDALTVTTTLSVGDEPFGMVVDAPGDVPTTLYVGNIVGNSLSIIDIPSLTVVATYPSG